MKNKNRPEYTHIDNSDEIKRLNRDSEGSGGVAATR